LNGVLDGDYAEVYAGGASIALALLYGDYVRRIHINDLDPGIFAFWSAARDKTEELVRRVRTVPLTMDEWRHQRAVQMASQPDPMDLAVSTFYLNRTNRSGIVRGGPIGGTTQGGTWGIGARFNRDDLVRRIERVGRFRSRIAIHQLDGARFIESVASTLPNSSLVYLDPPYFVKGQQRLYANYYGSDDHGDVAQLVAGLRTRWIVSYDNAPEIRRLYGGFDSLTYGIAYSASNRYVGQEVMFFSPGFVVPGVVDPPALTAADLARMERLLRQQPATVERS
jgi:DNA adenine methylase